LYDGGRKAALRKDRGTLHEKHDGRLADLLADTVLDSAVHSVGPRWWGAATRASAHFPDTGSALILGCARLQGERVQFAAHPSAQRLIHQLMLLHSALAAEFARDDMGGIVVAVAAQILDRDPRVG